MRLRCRLTWLPAVAALIGLPAPALAQEQPPPAAGPVASPAEQAPPSIEALEVIGERLDATDVQDEAQAITAFTAEDLDRANIVNIDSLASSVPGLHVGQSGQQAIVTLRGIGTENASITGEPGVAFHVDGVNFSQPSAARVAFFDLETLDVKRGPQGLQGGKNSTSGSINLITKKPHDEYEIDGDVLFGNFDRVRARGAVNIPIGEFMATRVAFFHEDRDGYLDNETLSDSRDPFDADDFGLRTHFRVTPTDTLDMILSYNYFKQTGNGPQADIVPISKEATCQPTGNAPNFTRQTVMPFRAACNFEEIAPNRVVIIDGRPVLLPAEVEFRPGAEDADSRAIHTDFPSAQDNRFWGFTGTIDWDVPALPLLGESRLLAIGGFQHSETAFRWDFDGTDLVQSKLDQNRGAEQHTAELRWSGTIAERVDWLMGSYFAREKGERELFAPALQQSEDGTSTNSFIRTDQSTENKSYGAFAHGNWSITDTVRFELGGRWVKDEKQTRLLRNLFIGTPNSNTFVGCTGPLGFRSTPGGDAGDLLPGRANSDCELTFRGTSWGAGLDWRPFGGDHLLYANIDRGYKSGGFRTGGRGEYKPEKIWAYALGSKSEFLGQRLQLNIEGFFYAYEDMQLVVLDGFALRTENSDARMYGFDIEAKASPIPGLNLSAIVSHLKTEVLDYYSLDPADVFNTDNFPEGVTEIQAFNFQNRRLQERDLAEENVEEGRGGTGLLRDQNNCNRTPPGQGAPINCGLLGDKDGLDDFSGNELSRSPEWKVTLSAEYEIPLGRFGFLTPRVQYTWQDDTYYRAFNKDFDLQKDHHLTDAKLIWRSPEDVWAAEIFVTNIEDEAPKQNILVGSRFFGAPPLAWYGAPRFYGVRVGLKY